MKILTIGDAMIRGEQFSEAAKLLGDHEIVTTDWEVNWERLQNRRLVIEQQGPDVEEVPPMFKDNKDADIVLGLFAPFSAKAMDTFDNLKLIGVARAGTENVDVKAATERGIIVVHVMGRNAEAVSDFAIGLMLSEARNIARAHTSIKNGQWQKVFSNSNHIPELKGKTVGIIGFGYIGRLVAKKLSGFDVNVIVYDPFVTQESIEMPNVRLVDKDTLFSESDFITIHARLTKENYHFIGREELAKMKPTAYLINTARSGLIDTDALVEALSEKRIAGAGLDVFDIEPIPQDHPLLSLDNVTLTTHIAGTTTDALTQSPYLLVGEVKKILDGGKANWIKNPEVLDHPKVKEWLGSYVKNS
ncbi:MULTISPECIES: 2-hydroxyacid dehydrogenase [unclassified Geobacillus]|uniref:2-hydroxyacid dehydrogenase n=1 Tax=unclassified Geobacillus TaxID=2642459 RepID=UPI0010135E61|nr:MULTISPECIES: 2-hydroxyacid dehydrogenase [unclassified Geobacillus]MCG6796564.1 2-hydroxyacid dehydrogenase [Geobacillus sp. YHL]RXS86499.1 3-phosphoglycerate dehydrogenase [Geobacillus sp. PK12]